MNDDAHMHPGIDPYLEPERTSLSAIFGFIFSLGGCCLGVTALIGLPLSIFGMISISRSNKRLGGMGFAVAGLLLGLLSLALWGGCLGATTFGLGQATTLFGAPVERALQNIEKGAYDGARANLLSPAADASDAELQAFHDAYTSTLGNYKQLPGGTIEYFSAFLALGPIAQAANGGNNVFPIPATFDAGPALILIGFDPSGQGVTRLTIIDTAGNEYTLPMPKGWETPETPSDTDTTTPDAPSVP